MSARGETVCDSVPFISVSLVFTHPDHGSVTHYTQDFNPWKNVSQLKQDMAKLTVPVEQQIWKFKGRELRNTETLEEAKVNDNDTIEVSSKM